jgi:hypothetical protein
MAIVPNEAQVDKQFFFETEKGLNFHSLIMLADTFVVADR